MPESGMEHLDRDALLLALDGAIASLMTVRAIVADKVPQKPAEEAPGPDAPCTHPPDRRGETFDSTYCRACGADLGASTTEAPKTDQ